MVVDSHWAVERLEWWEVKLVEVNMVTVPMVGMVVVWESSLGRSAAVLW